MNQQGLTELYKEYGKFDDTVVKCPSYCQEYYPMRQWTPATRSRRVLEPEPAESTMFFRSVLVPKKTPMAVEMYKKYLGEIAPPQRAKQEALEFDAKLWWWRLKPAEKAFWLAK